MATVDKNFKVKNGLVVEGTTATVNGEDVLTTASTTTDLTEGTNLYFTDQRAVDAVTDEINTAVTTAVDALDTDAIEEGDTNLYFTDQRAIDAVGGTATSENTADTVVKRDGNGDFSAGDITVSELSIGSTGRIYEDESDLIIANIDDTDIEINANDLRLNATDDIRLEADDFVGITSLNGIIEFDAPNGNVFINGDQPEDKIVTQGTLNSDLEALTTDDIDEGTTNLYFTNQRALDATSAAYDAAGAAATAQQNAEDYADGLASNYEVAGAAAAAQSAAESYADSAVSALVNGAPELLDTLNELAAAINDDASFASTIATSIGEKQNTLTAGSNIDITADTISVTGLDAADISDFNTAALSATASAYDAAGAAATAEGNANDYTDTALEDYTPTSGLDAVVAGYGYLKSGDIDVSGDIQTAIDELTTTDIEEGTNLYFTDTRAVDALEAVVPNFTDVEINSLAKQVAATSSSLGSVPVTAYEFAKASYKTAKFLVKISNGTENEVTEVLLTLDSADNIAITEYAIVGTNGSRGEITADISGLNVRLRVNPVNDSTINVVGTLLV